MEAWTPNVLLLGSGGVKGFLTIGSLMFFEKTKLLKNIKKVVGISIGSVIGLFYVVGCSMTEILEISLMTQLSEVMTNIDIVNIMRTNGLVSHDIFRKRMNDKVTEKFGFIPTLQQLYMMTGYEFEVVVTNLDNDEAEYFNHQTQPNLSCVEAVLMSMSIPLLFQTYIYNNHIYMDGAICDPFPIDRYPRDKVFAIMLKSTHDDPKESFYNYLAKVIQTFTSTKLRSLEIPRHCKILNLEYKVNDTIGMKITFEKRVDMVLLGYLRAYQFYTELYKNNPNEYPMSIQKYIPLEFFSALSFEKNQEDMILEYVEEPSEVDTEEMEDEADEYLEELFDSDITIDTSSDSDFTTSEDETDEEEILPIHQENKNNKQLLYHDERDDQSDDIQDKQESKEDPEEEVKEDPEEEVKEEPEEEIKEEPEEGEVKEDPEEGEDKEDPEEEEVKEESEEEDKEDIQEKRQSEYDEDVIEETNMNMNREDGSLYSEDESSSVLGSKHLENEVILIPTETRRLSERVSGRMSSLRKTKIYSPGKILSGMKKSKKSKKKHKKPEWIDKK